jgi:hypothetical protein
LHVAALTDITKKQSAVLHDEEMGKFLLLSELEGSLSHSESNTDNEFDECSLIDVVNDGGDEDDNIT